MSVSLPSPATRVLLVPRLAFRRFPLPGSPAAEPEKRELVPVPDCKVTLLVPPLSVLLPLTAYRLSLPSPAIRELEMPPPRSVLLWAVDLDPETKVL